MAEADSGKGLYAGLEEKYYNLLDSLEQKGIPVYKVVDPIEAANIPTFPLAVVLLAILIGLVIFAANSVLFGSVSLNVMVQDSDGKAISGALVSATAGTTDFGTKTTGDDGKAVISVPAGSEVSINASKKGYNDKQVKYTAKGAGETTTITLAAAITTTRKTISLMAAGTSRAFGKDVQLELTCTGTNFDQTLASSGGQLQVDVPSNCDTLKAKPIGNYSVSNDTIFLSSDASYSVSLSENTGAGGGAVVTLANAKGETLPGIDVSLVTVTQDGNAGTVFDTKQTSAAGTAEFTAVPSGTYTINAYDRAGNYAEFDGISAKISQQIKDGTATQFSAVLSQSVAGKINLVVKDKATGQAVAGASVKLSKGQNEVKTLTTDDQGTVQFTVGEDIQFSLTVDKAGYLILNANVRPGAGQQELLLEQATAENSQSLLVTILDENQKPIENARVKLRGNADGAQFGPELVTGLDGRALFERVPEGTYYVYAEKPGFGNKSSDPIAISSRKQNTLTLLVPIGSGSIEADVVGEDGKPVTNATVKAVDFDTLATLQETGADSSGKAVFSLRADKRAFFVVSADGFATATTVPVPLQRDVTVTKQVTLLKDIPSLGMQLDGLYSGQESVSEAGAALTPGQKYTAKFTLLVPKGAAFEDVGAHIRAGGNDASSIEKDYIYITDVRAAYKSLTMGTSYTPNMGQGPDLQHLTNGSAKWANISMKGVEPGKYEIEADLQVRPEAKIGTPLEVSYRAWGRSGAGYVRYPNDAELGTSENASTKQGLFANTQKRTFSAGPSSLCDGDFCSKYEVEDLREKIVSSIVSDYTGQLGNSYRLAFEISSSAKTPFTQAQLSIKDPTSSIAIESYTIRTALGQQNTGKGVGSEISLPVGDMAQDSVVSGEAVFSAKKEGNVPLTVTITSGSGGSQSVSYTKTLNVRILPASLLHIDILPKIIVPFVNNNLLVHVTDANGQKVISNASVDIKKDGTVVASGQTDIDGVFAYTLASPSDGSVIGVAVEKSGFQPSERELKVTPNILETMPETLKLNMTSGGQDFKTLVAKINNFSQIPLEVGKVQFSREFDGYTTFSVDSPTQGDVLAPDSNATLSATVRLGVQGAQIEKPTKLQGTVNIELLSQQFKQKWLATIPLEITIGFGDEVDDTSCFTINPSDWKIFGATNQAQKLEVGISNSCSVGGEKVQLTNLSARIVSGSDTLFGKFRATSTIAGSQATDLDTAFKVISTNVPEGAEEKITFEFTPNQVVSGKADGRIEIQAIHPTSKGEQKIVQKLTVSVNVNNLNECVEVLANQDVTINSCPGNVGFGNYGGRFSQYSGGTYGAFDPYQSRYGYGQGTPPWLTPSSQATGIGPGGVSSGLVGNRAPYGGSYYDYTYSGNYMPNNPFYGGYMNGYANSYFPNAYYQQPFYSGGIGSFAQGFNNSWSCGPATVQVRNNCANPVELSFQSQPGITVSNKATKVEPGNIADVTVEPTNFFGRYGLDILAKASGSNEAAVPVKRLFVNVTNEFAKDYRDCISIDPAGTISFNDFLGRPAVLTVRNRCYAEGVFVNDDPSAITFATASPLSPTNENPNALQVPGTLSGQAAIPGSPNYIPGQATATGTVGTVGQAGRAPIGMPTYAPGQFNNPNLYYASNVAPSYFPQPVNYGQAFGGIIQTVESLGADYQTTPDGRIVQSIKFNLIKNVHPYRNNAPPADFFDSNPFKDIGNLRYFTSSGYYAVNVPSILFVRFTTQSGLDRSVSFPLTLQDFWPLLQYGEQLAKKLVTFGDASLTPAKCLNQSALNFSDLHDVPVDITLRTMENANGRLFIINGSQNQIGVCGTVDKLELLEPGDFKNQSTGLVMHVRPDPADPEHELQITFDTSQGWNGQRTQFNNSMLGKVTRATPSIANPVNLGPIAVNVKAGTSPNGPKGQPTGTGGGQGQGGTGGTVTAAATTCTTNRVSNGTLTAFSAGQTGTAVYQKYGFQNIQYKWGVDKAAKDSYVGKNACDSYSDTGVGLRNLAASDPPMFCDALQASISLSQKASEVAGMVKAIAAANNGTGSCVTSKSGFNCSDNANRNSAEMFRYALSQVKATDTAGNEAAYFLGNDSFLVDLSGEIRLNSKLDSGTRALVSGVKGANSTPDNYVNIITQAAKLQHSVLDNTQGNSLPPGTDIVLELPNWDATGMNKDTEWTSPQDIGGQFISGHWYVMPLATYKLLHNALSVCSAVNTPIQGLDQGIYLYSNSGGKWFYGGPNNDQQIEVTDAMKINLLERNKRDMPQDPNSVGPPIYPYFVSSGFSTECDYSNGAQTKSITTKFLTQLSAGTWKLTARNTADMSQEVKDAVMKRGKWETGKNTVTGYANLPFFSFYRQDIAPYMYLMTDYYSEGTPGFTNALKNSNMPIYSGLFNDTGMPVFSVDGSTDGTNLAKAGRYRALISYNWSDAAKGLKVTLGDYNSLADLKLDGSGNNPDYVDNPLFDMPMDGPTQVSWGTKFTGPNSGLLNMAYNATDQAVGGGVKSVSDSPAQPVRFVYNNTYDFTKTGEIANFSRNAFTYAPSEPVGLGISIRKGDAKSPAGIMFDFLSNGTKVPISVGFNLKSDTIAGRSGVILPEQHNGGDLCSGSDVQLSRPAPYEGWVFNNNTAGTSTELTSLVYIPSRIGTPPAVTTLVAPCIRTSGSIRAQYPMNNVTINDIGKEGTLSIDATKPNYQTLYNLKSLLEMIRDTGTNNNAVCVSAEPGNGLHLFWNEAAFVPNGALSSTAIAPAPQGVQAGGQAPNVGSPTSPYTTPSGQSGNQGHNSGGRP